jgi:RimJ/RimL family protein N-acetyltransferase
MEKMPYQPHLDAVVSTAPLTDAQPAASSDWRTGLPTLDGRVVTLRELRPSDATSLFALLTTEEVSRFVSPPPTSVDGFERFIAWTHRQRAAGAYACFAIVPRGSDIAVGLFQVRSLEPTFGTAEWGFVMGSEYWGSGVFADGARLVIEFAFDVIGVHRLEARAAVANGRGNGALRKIGAVMEGVLRRSFLRNGQYHDQALWTIVRDEWRDGSIGGNEPVVLH